MLFFLLSVNVLEPDWNVMGGGQNDEDDAMNGSKTVLINLSHLFLRFSAKPYYGTTLVFHLLTFLSVYKFPAHILIHQVAYINPH